MSSQQVHVRAPFGGGCREMFVEAVVAASA